MANSNFQLLSLSSQMLKTLEIDFQKSWLEKYIVKNVITQDVVSLYMTFHRGAHDSRLESKELDMQT